MGLIPDTDILIAIERGLGHTVPAALARLGPAGFLAAIQVTELSLGIHMANSERRREVRAAYLDAVLGHLTLVPFAELEARETARVQVLLRRAGQTIGERDLQIAATALVHGHTVVTRNTREYQRVPGLLVLTPGEAGIEGGPTGA